MVVLTEEGAFRTKTIRRKPEADRWDAKVMEKMKDLDSSSKSISSRVMTLSVHHVMSQISLGMMCQHVLLLSALSGMVTSLIRVITNQISVRTKPKAHKSSLKADQNAKANHKPNPFS